MSQFRQDFLQFALRQNVLKFGEFTTKAGRQSPYFFNAGLFNARARQVLRPSDCGKPSSV